MIILETDRLLLRTTTLDDTNDLYEQVFSNEDVVQFTFGREGLNIEETEEFIRKNCNFDSKLGLSTLIEKKSGNIIGLAGNVECNYVDEKDYEFGFILGKDFWGKGYATEIGQVQINFVKNELKAKKVLALVHKDNIASIKTIEKLGLIHLTTVQTDQRGNREVYIKELTEVVLQKLDEKIVN